MPTMSTSELTKLSHTLARALSVDQVNQLGRDTGQAERLRTVTPHRLFLAIVTDGTQSQSGPTFQREQPFEFGDGRTSGHTIGHVLTHHGAVLETRYERRLGPEPACVWARRSESRPPAGLKSALAHAGRRCAAGRV